MPKQVLYTEDNPDDVILVRRALARASVQVDLRTVDNARSVLEHFQPPTYPATKEPPKLPDILVLDLRLHGANGLDVLMWLRQNPATRTLPVIIYTSLNDPVSETEAGKLGIVAFVQKEATGRKLMEALLPLL